MPDPAGADDRKRERTPREGGRRLAGQGVLEAPRLDAAGHGGIEVRTPERPAGRLLQELLPARFGLDDRGRLLHVLRERLGRGRRVNDHAFLLDLLPELRLLGEGGRGQRGDEDREGEKNTSDHMGLHSQRTPSIDRESSPG